MRTRVVAIVFCLMASVGSPALAQYAPGGTPDRATGERYHVEVGGFFWNPAPTIRIRSEGLTEARLGSEIDFVNELGLERQNFRQLKVVLRPATKHKFRFEFTPINYDNPAATISRDLVFNGQLYRLSIPVATEMRWNAYRFAYEWDMVYASRGFFGIILEAKYTDVEARLSQFALGLEEFVRARAPIPALGAIGRVYVAQNISITGELSGFRLPESIDEGYKAKYVDFDLYGSVNFTDHFGAQVGFRSFDVYYLFDGEDEGTLKLKGLYFGGVARF